MWIIWPSYLFLNTCGDGGCARPWKRKARGDLLTEIELSPPIRFLWLYGVQLFSSSVASLCVGNQDRGMNFLDLSVYCIWGYVGSSPAHGWNRHFAVDQWHSLIVSQCWLSSLNLPVAWWIFFQLDIILGLSLNPVSLLISLTVYGILFSHVVTASRSSYAINALAIGLCLLAGFVSHGMGWAFQVYYGLPLYIVQCLFYLFCL